MALNVVNRAFDRYAFLKEPMLQAREPVRVRQSTSEIAREFLNRLESQEGINEVPRSIITGIINYCEAEALNRIADQYQNDE